jgi:hypothetical protein
MGSAADSPLGTKLFIVHGHDGMVKLEVAEFIQESPVNGQLSFMNNQAMAAVQSSRNSRRPQGAARAADSGGSARPGTPAGHRMDSIV